MLFKSILMSMERSILIQKYLIEGKSYREIAEEFGWNKSTVGYYLKKYKIPKQDTKKRQKEKVLRSNNHPMYGKRGKDSLNFGRTHKKETIEKIRKSNTGIKKPISETHRQKLIASAKKRKRKPDHLRKTPLYRAIRILPEYKIWRISVFKRDKWTCMFCKKTGGILNADHIKPMALILKENHIVNVSQSLDCSELWNKTNGRTLCSSCHKNTQTYGRKMKV